MARNWQEMEKLADGRTVGFSLLKRKGQSAFVVHFDGLDNGATIRRSTGLETMSKALAEAQAIIRRHFTPHQQQATQSWVEVIDDLKRKLTYNNNRIRTFKDYASTLNVLQSTVKTTGPGDVTEHKAQRFAHAFILGTFTRGGDKTFARSPTTLNSHLRKLRSIWGKWLRIKPNPWESVHYVEQDDPNPTIPSEEVVSDFMAWVEKKYAGWNLPSLFLRTKAVMGCRLHDLCSVKSSGLANGSLTLDPADAKTRNFRRIELDPELYASLASIKGETYLFEHYAQELRDFLKASGQRFHLIRAEYDPWRLHWFMVQLFTDYNAIHQDKIYSHDFRRRAITLACAAKIPMDQVSLMFGVSVATAVKYYRDSSKIDTADLHRSIRDALNPKVKKAEAS